MFKIITHFSIQNVYRSIRQGGATEGVMEIVCLFYVSEYLTSIKHKKKLLFQFFYFRTGVASPPPPFTNVPVKSR